MDTAVVYIPQYHAGSRRQQELRFISGPTRSNRDFSSCTHSGACARRAWPTPEGAKQPRANPAATGGDKREEITGSCSVQRWQGRPTGGSREGCPRLCAQSPPADGPRAAGSCPTRSHASGCVTGPRVQVPASRSRARATAASGDSTAFQLGSFELEPGLNGRLCPAVLSTDAVPPASLRLWCHRAECGTRCVPLLSSVSLGVICRRSSARRNLRSHKTDFVCQVNTDVAEGTTARTANGSAADAGSGG